MNATSKGGTLPSRRALGYEHLEKGKLVFQRMTKFMSFRNVRAWEDLRQEISQRTLAFLLAGVVLAYGLSLTSPSIWVNFPVALVLLLLLRRLSFNYEIRWSPDYHPDCCIHNQRPNVHPLSPVGPLLSFDLRKPSQTTSKRPETWRAGINAPAVEAAVDAFTQSIVKEWVTNLWYRLVTPDQDFPEELRLLINRAVAEIAVRIRRANLVNLLTRDLVDQFGHHLEVYRRAKDLIGPDVLDALSSSDQEERLRQAMLLQGELHVALTSPQAEYRVLRRLVGGVVTSALRPEEVQCSLLRILAREVVASAVLRPVMNLVNPALLNDLILSSIPVAEKKAAKRGGREDDSPTSEERAKSEPNSRGTSGVHEEGLKSEAAEPKARGPAKPSFGAEDVEKFEKKKKALAAEHWDQMWVGAKGKKQRALAEARERRAREGGGSGHSSAGEGEKDGTAFEWRKDASPQGSSTTSLSALLEKGEDYSPWSNRGAPELGSSLRAELHEAASNRPEPAVPGIGWEKDEWEDPVLDPTARTRSLSLDQPSTALEGAVTSRSVHGNISPVARLKVSEITATPGHFIKDEKVKTFYTRGKVGLAKLDANWMGLDAVPSTPGPPKSPLLSTRSEVIGSVSKFPPLSTRSEEGLVRDRAWEKERGFQSARTGSSSWNEALENATPKRRRRSLSGGLEALVSEETWGDVSGDESQAHRRSSFEEQPAVSDLHQEEGKLRRTSSENLWEAGKESVPASPKRSGVLSPGGWNRVLGRVVGARMEESAGKAFAVYTIAVADSDRSSWLVQRRYRNFEALHRRLKELPQYKLKLPPKRYLGPNLDGSFVLERRAHLDKYLQDLLAVPSVAESHEVWDFLSANSQAYGYGRSSSMIKTLAGNVDDVVDTMFRRLNEVSDELQGAITKGLKKAPTLTGTLAAGLSKQKPLPTKAGPVEVAMADQAYRGGEDEEAFVEVEDSVSGNGYGKTTVKGRVWGWAPLPEGGELVGNRPEEVIDQHGKILSGDAHPSFSTLEQATRRSGRKDAVAEEAEGTLSRTDSGGLLEESEEEGEEIPLPQEAHASKLSGPLLNLVDNVFQLQQYGWLRRQVVWMARQILEIGLGDAIDDFILTKIQWLRQPEVVAAAIDGLRGLLWPNGVWFANQQEADTWQQQQPAASGGKPGRGDGKTKEVEMLRPMEVGKERIRTALREDHPTRNVNRGNGSGRSDADGRGQPSVNSEGEIEWDWNPPKPQLTFEERLEAARKAALVRELFLDRAPAALVSLIGSKQYKRCARDVYNFLQSSVCVKQFTYSVLELLITTTFPELQALVHDVRTSGVTT